MASHLFGSHARAPRLNRNGLLGAAGSGPAAAQPPTDASTPLSFVLTALTVDGVTAYPLRDFASVYAGYLAREVTVADLVKIAQAITDKYRADGYFLTRAVVPPQAPGGHARIRVYEGYIGEIKISGDPAPALGSLLPLRTSLSHPSRLQCLLSDR